MNPRDPDIAKVRQRVLEIIHERRFMPDLTELLTEIYVQAVCDVAKVTQATGWRPPTEVLE